MRNKIVGGVIVAWGILMLVRWYLMEGSLASGAYGTGQLLALGVGVLLIIAGIYTFFKGK